MQAVLGRRGRINTQEFYRAKAQVPNQRPAYAPSTTPPRKNGRLLTKCIPPSDIYSLENQLYVVVGVREYIYIIFNGCHIPFPHSRRGVLYTSLF